MAEKEMANREKKGQKKKVKESAGVLITRYIDDVSPVFMNNFSAKKWKPKKNKNDVEMEKEFSKCAECTFYTSFITKIVSHNSTSISYLLAGFSISVYDFCTIGLPYQTCPLDQW